MGDSTRISQSFSYSNVNNNSNNNSNNSKNLKRQQLYRENISVSSGDLLHNHNNNNSYGNNRVITSSGSNNNSGFHSKSKSMHHTQNKILIQQTQQQIQQYHNSNINNNNNNSNNNSNNNNNNQLNNGILHNSTTTQFNNNNNNLSNSLYISNGPSSFPPSLRKFRHIKSIIGRNLESCIKSNNPDPILLSTYYTLHAPPNVNKNQNIFNNYNHHYFGNDDDTINTTPTFNNNINNTNNNSPWNDMENIEIEAIENILNSDNEDNNKENNNDNNNNDDDDESPTNDKEIQEKADEINSNENIVKSQEIIGEGNNEDKFDEIQDNDGDNEEIDNEDDIEDDIEDDEDDLPSEFYTSEVIYDSNNPLWNPFDCYKQLPVEILDNYSSFNICVWDSNNEDLPPIFQSDIDLTQLEFIAPEMKHFSQLILPANTILFELKDGYYVTKETKNKMNSPNLNDIQKIINNEKRKAFTGSKTLFLSLVYRKLLNIEKQEKSKEFEKMIEDILEEQSSYTEKLRQLETQRNRIKLLREESENQKKLLKKDQDKFQDLKKGLVSKSVQLTKAGIIFYQSLKELIKNTELLKMDLHLVHNLKVSWEKKKWSLITQIRSIYPIGQGNKLLTINGLPLPNSDYNGFDEEQIATALGYVCHILHLASKYLNVPLRYPMTPMGSRSFIKDEISHHSSSKFPLYSKGVEKRIFDYAVFLLNKNIKQLLNSQGLFGNFYLKETLANVLILLGKGKVSELNNPNYNPIIIKSSNSSSNDHQIHQQQHHTQNHNINQHHFNELQQQLNNSNSNNNNNFNSLHLHHQQHSQNQQHYQNQHHFNNNNLHHQNFNNHHGNHQNHHLQQPH